MSICDNGIALIDEIRSVGLSNQLESSVEAIRAHIFKNAQLANLSEPLDILIGSRFERRLLSFSSRERVVELPESDLLSLTGHIYPPSTLRGIYIPEYGKIFLNSELWCIETYLHEIFHAISVYSVRRDLLERHLLLIEGLTEFFTGCLLRTQYPLCYENCWKTGRESRCYCTYQSQVKVWISLCHVIPISEIFRIYFWDGNENWELEWSRFIQAIRDFGYPNFHDILQRRQRPSWGELHRECIRNFRRAYTRIYDSLDNPLDLSRIME